MSSPYLAMRSARLNFGGDPAADPVDPVIDDDLSEGGELSDEDDSSESLDSLSELLSLVRLVREAGKLGLGAPSIFAGSAFLNKW